MLTIVVATLVLVVGALVGVSVIVQNEMYLQCCNGIPCIDTYYTIEDNTCHLVLCENNPIANKDDCTYDGANITNSTLIN